MYILTNSVLIMVVEIIGPSSKAHVAYALGDPDGGIDARTLNALRQTPECLGLGRKATLMYLLLPSSRAVPLQVYMTPDARAGAILRSARKKLRLHPRTREFLGFHVNPDRPILSPVFQPENQDWYTLVALPDEISSTPKKTSNPTRDGFSGFGELNQVYYPVGEAFKIATESCRNHFINNLIILPCDLRSWMQRTCSVSYKVDVQHLFRWEYSSILNKMLETTRKNPDIDPKIKKAFLPEASHYNLFLVIPNDFPSGEYETFGKAGKDYWYNKSVLTTVLIPRKLMSSIPSIKRREE